MDATRRKMTLQLGLLVAVFALPVLLSSYLYFFGQDLVPRDTVAQGDLIAPARPLPEQTLYDLAGDAVPLAAVKGKWTIVYLTREACGPDCRQRVDDMDKVRQALGEDSHRVQTLLLAHQPTARASLEAATADLPRVLVRTGDEGGLGGELLDTFQPQATPWGRTYIVDPLGNVMMAYPAGTDPKWVLIDLRTLLKASQIG